MKKRFISIFTVIILTLFTSSVFAENNDKKSNISPETYASLINQLYYFIQNYYVDEVDPEVLYEGAVKGMLDSLGDPYSVYMDESAWRNITDTTQGSFGGVGLMISKPVVSTEEKPAYVEVSQPIENTPGYKAGIQSGDLIISINGTDTSTITMDEVLSKLRGPVGEEVTVTIRRRYVKDFDVTLKREVIENVTVKYGMIGDYGYIRMTEFSKNTASRFVEAINSFKEQNYKGLIIDLRSNGGGLLNTAVNIADMFIDEGEIVSTKSRIQSENQTFTASPARTIVKNIPVVVLVNEYSASASEILTAALKDTKKAYIIGTTTYGKGSVQLPSNLLNKDGFKMTIAKYYVPSGVNITGYGVHPDMEVDFDTFTEDEQKSLAKLYEDNKISTYVYNHPDMNDADITSYAKTIAAEYNLSERICKKLVKNEVYRTRPSELYDLEFDVQLNAAIDFLKSGNYSASMKKTTTVKQDNEKYGLKAK